MVPLFDVVIISVRFWIVNWIPSSVFAFCVQNCATSLLGPVRLAYLFIASRLTTGAGCFKRNPEVTFVAVQWLLSWYEQTQALPCIYGSGLWKLSFNSALLNPLCPKISIMSLVLGGSNSELTFSLALALQNGALIPFIITAMCSFLDRHVLPTILEFSSLAAVLHVF